MEQTNLRLGVILMIATTFVFAMQDGISRYLAGEYNVFMIVMIRYWFFAAFVIFLAKANVGSIRKAASTNQLFIQCLRGIILAVEICIMVLGFVLIGLIEVVCGFDLHVFRISFLLFSLVFISSAEVFFAFQLFASVLLCKLMVLLGKFNGFVW